MVPTTTPRSSRRYLLLAVLAAALLVAPLDTIRAQQSDGFFESSIDGGWVGTIRAGKTTLLMQLNLNIDGKGGIGFAVLPDNLAGAPTAVDVLATDISAPKPTKIKLTVDEDSPLARALGATTFKLTYKSVTDTLSGKVSGGVKGKVALERMRPDLPLQRLWSGTVKADGQTVFVLLEFTEQDGNAGRFAQSDVGGTAWVGDEQGTIVGQRNGSNVTGTLSLPSGDLDLSLKLKKRNNQIKGTAKDAGDTIKVTLVPATGNGKLMKLKSAAPKSIPAGQATQVLLKGASFFTGAVVHADAANVQIGAVSRISSKQLSVMLMPSAGVADGTAVSLRVVNADGQTADKKLLTVSDGGGGGGGGPTVSFSGDIQPIFSGRCALPGCHNTASAASGMVLEAGSAFANIVGVPSAEQPTLQRVNPGNAEASYLVRKIRGDSGINGGRMPLNRTPLSDAQINTIITWINEGAANNRQGQ